MKLSAKSGANLAAAAAVAFIAGATPIATASAADYKVKCFGLNACKGNGSCKGLSNSCKGQNACKGQGFASLSKSACLAKGGKTTKG